MSVSNDDLRCPAEITAMIPCFNEEECVERAYLEIKNQLHRFDDSEILFVDDGSTDRTLEIIKAIAVTDPRVKYLSFARNFGLEAAFSAGFKYASKPWTVQLDADLQSPPSEAPLLVRKALEGYDMVFGIRARRKDPLLRKLGSLGQQWVAHRLLSIKLPFRASVFRVVRSSVAKKIVATRLKSPYFIAAAPLLGARYTTVDTRHQQREAGVAKWSALKLISHAMDLWIGFSVRPLAIVHLSAVALATATAVLIGLFLAGLLPVEAVVVVATALAAATLLGLGVLTRYMIPHLRVRGEIPQFLIRDSNIRIDPADDLFEFEPGRVAAASERLEP